MRHADGLYYEWYAPGLPFSVQLGFEVIERIGAEMAGQQETGGVLFGRRSTDGGPLFIDGYRRVSCDHSRGTAWSISRGDRKRFERALRKGRAVGFYRSHLRRGLYLDETDFALIKSFFANPNDVFLLIRPREGQAPAAGFFLWEEDDIHRQWSYAEFPFATSELGLSVPEGASGPVRRMRVPAAATAATLLSLVGVWGVEHWVPALKGPEGAGQAESLPALSVERNGSYLELSWDAKAPALAALEEATLRIRDGGIRKQIHLDVTQLHTGHFAYLPLGNEVTFDLEMGGEEAVSETFRLEEGPARRVPVVRAEAGQPKVPERLNGSPQSSGM